MEARISVVTLVVADLDTARAFYTRMGWRLSVTSTDDVAFFQAGGMVLGLYGRESLAVDAQVSPEGSGFRGVALAHNARSRGEVDEILAEAAAAGATITKAAHDTFWGGYAGYFADPDGHLWEVAFNPHWPLTVEGNVLLPTAKRS
jgi:hypothetical protein